MMSQWGISFDYIEQHWTDRQFYMMSQRLMERIKQQSGKSSKAGKLNIQEFVESQIR